MTDFPMPIYAKFTLIIEWYSYIRVCIYTDTLDVTLIVLGNGHGGLSSIPRPCCLRSTFALMPLKKAWIYLFSSLLCEIFFLHFVIHFLQSLHLVFSSFFFSIFAPFISSFFFFFFFFCRIPLHLKGDFLSICILNASTLSQ